MELIVLRAEVDFEKTSHYMAHDFSFRTDRFDKANICTVYPYCYLKKFQSMGWRCSSRDRTRGRSHLGFVETRKKGKRYDWKMTLICTPFQLQYPVHCTLSSTYVTTGFECLLNQTGQILSLRKSWRSAVSSRSFLSKHKSEIWVIFFTCPIFYMKLHVMPVQLSVILYLCQGIQL